MSVTSVLPRTHPTDLTYHQLPGPCVTDHQQPSTSGVTYTPGNSSTGLYTPGNSSTGFYTPGNSSTGIYTPGNSSTGIYTPIYTPAFTPSGPSTCTSPSRHAGSCPGVTYTPNHSSTGHYTPVYSPSFTPALTPAHTTPTAPSTPTAMTKARIPGAPLRVVDTGWAWVVAASACFCLFFTCGFAYSIGVYYVVFLETFGAGKGKTAWISSLNFGILCAVGPISSLLINTISCRFSVFIGGILSTVGLFISAFAGDIHMLFITFGILTGAGFGLVFTPCVVVISEYFLKYRVIAMGLSISGTGLGTIVYPWLSRLLLDVYGWRGALIMSAGINAHVCIAALVMRPNREPKKVKVINRRKQTVGVSQNSISSPKSEIILTSKEQSMNSVKSPASSLESKNNQNLTSPSSVESKNSYNLTQSAVSVQSQQHNTKNNNNKNNSTAQSALKDSSIWSTSSGQPLNTSLVKRVVNDFDLDIFTKPTFLLIAANTFLFCFGMSVMYTHISSYAASVGLAVSSRDSLISAIGFTNLIGRVVLGLAAQCLPINATWLFIGSYLLAGLGIACCAIFTSFMGLLLCVCMFGFFSAGFGPLLSEVTCLAVGVMKFSMAYGYLMVFMAGGTMIGAPIAGLLYDNTRYYQGSFYLGGACLILSSTIMLLDVVPSRWRSRNYEPPEERTVYVHKDEPEDYVSSV